jgi:hypothetical protein
MATQMTPEEIDEVFREYNEAVIRGTPIEEALARRMKDAAAGLNGYTLELQASLRQLKSSALSLAQQLKNGDQGAKIYNGIVEAGAEALDSYLQKYGPAGKALGMATVGLSKLAGVVTEQSDALFNSYTELTRFGAGLTTGLDGVMQMSQQMGYTVEGLGEFTSLLSRSAPELALLGGTVAAGSERFAQLVKDVDGQREMWRRLGLDVAQQNEAYSGFIRITTLSGRAQRLTGDGLAAASQEYLYNLVTLSKLTGKTVEELNAEREAVMSQQRFLAVQRDLEKRAAEADLRGDSAEAQRLRGMVERNLLVYNSVPKELQTAVADAMTGFLGTSDESIKLLRTMPGFAQMLASQNFEYSEAMALADKEASHALNNFANTLGKSGAFDTILLPLVGLVKQESAALNMTMDQRIAAARNEIEAQKAQTGAVADQAALRETQLRTAQDIQSLIGVFRGPVTFAMRGLATATGLATTALTDFTGISTRGAPSGAGTLSAPVLAAAPVTTASLPAPTPQVSTAVAASAAPAAPTTPTPQVSTAVATSAAPAAPVDRDDRVGQDIPLQYSRNGQPVSKAEFDEKSFFRNTSPRAAPAAPVQEFAQGGIATGPTSGYRAMLDGVNAIVPLGAGRSIPVQMPDMSMTFNEQMTIMSQQMSLLDDLVKETRNNNMLTERLLKVAQS